MICVTSWWNQTLLVTTETNVFSNTCSLIEDISTSMVSLKNIYSNISKINTMLKQYFLILRSQAFNIEARLKSFWFWSRFLVQWKFKSAIQQPEMNKPNICLSVWNCEKLNMANKFEIKTITKTKKTHQRFLFLIKIRNHLQKIYTWHDPLLVYTLKSWYI